MTTVFLTSGSSWTVPVDWNNSNNSVECIASGADGVQVSGTAAGQIGPAGGGGAYAKRSNINLTISSTINFKVGNTSNVNTYFNGTSMINCSVGAVGANGVTGGSSGLCIGDVCYSGGNAHQSNANTAAGGAAGPHGAGGNGTTTSAGGGDNGWGGAGANGTNSGSNGNEWGTNLGSGGGGFGSTASFGPSNGGNYGAGGGGSYSVIASQVPIRYEASRVGLGAPGIIRIVYSPVPAPTISSVSSNTGTIVGGTSVTITGLNFTNASQVTFGGVAATNIVVVNDSTITCKTPAHTVGFVTVAITTPPGTGSLSNAFQYIAGVKFRWQLIG